MLTAKDVSKLYSQNYFQDFDRYRIRDIKNPYDMDHIAYIRIMNRVTILLKDLKRLRVSI